MRAKRTSWTVTRHKTHLLKVKRVNLGSFLFCNINSVKKNWYWEQEKYYKVVIVPTHTIVNTCLDSNVVKDIEETLKMCTISPYLYLTGLRATLYYS